MIHIERKTLVIRGGEKFKKFGDPYDYCVSVFVSGHHGYFYGLCGKFSHKDYLEIKSELAKIGVTKGSWERMRKETIKRVETK